MKALSWYLPGRFYVNENLSQLSQCQQRFEAGSSRLQIGDATFESTLSLYIYIHILKKWNRQLFTLTTGMQTMWGGYCYSFTELLQGCTNHGLQVVRATEFCAVEPSTCTSSVWNLLRAILLATRNLRWLQDFGNICAPLAYKHVVSHSYYLTLRHRMNSR